MKALALLLLVVAAQLAVAQTDRTGLELGATMDLHKRPSLYTRVSYSVPIRKMRFDAGAIGLFGRDGGFGFDVLIGRPIGAVEPFAGTRLMVWEASMSVGFPLGLR